MNFYETHILPYILNFAMKQPDMKIRRERLIPPSAKADKQQTATCTDGWKVNR